MDLIRSFVSLGWAEPFDWTSAVDSHRLLAFDELLRSCEPAAALAAYLIHRAKILRRVWIRGEHSKTDMTEPHFGLIRCELLTVSLPGCLSRPLGEPRLWF
jgi:hypothetical protein